MNFFKKHWVTILIIVFFSIVIIIGFFEGIQETKQEQKSLSNNHKELEDNKEPNQPSRTKREIQPPQNQNPSPQTNTTSTPNSKIKITQEKFNKIASYIFSENENEVLSLNLSEEENKEINEIKNSYTVSLNIQKDRQKKINQYQQALDDYNEKISKLNPEDGYDEIKIKSLNDMLQRAEKEKNRLQKNYDKFLKDDEKSTLSSLNSLYEITSNEG